MPLAEQQEQKGNLARAYSGKGTLPVHIPESLFLWTGLKMSEMKWVSLESAMQRIALDRV